MSLDEAESIESAVGSRTQVDGKNCDGGEIENDKNKIETGFHNSVCKEKSVRFIRTYSCQGGIVFHGLGSFSRVPTIRLSSSSITSVFNLVISVYLEPSPSLSAAISQRLSPSATT